MLRRDGEPKQVTFADQARAVQAVPPDHRLLRMRRAVDWAAVEAQLARYYDPAQGRPGYPPAVLLRMLILEQYADLSDRDAHAEVGYNLLYRAFVGLGADEVVPDDTTLVRFRDRLGEAGLRQVFETLNAQWAAAGLLGTERRVCDGVHFWAKVARRSWVRLMREGRQLVVEAVAQVEPVRADTLRAAFVPPPAEPEPRGEEALRVEGERTVALLAAVADVADPQVQARVAQVRTLVAGEGDRVVSFVDPDARWGHKAPDKPFCGYKAHESLDPDSRLITAVDVVPGNANEAVRTGTLLAREAPALPEGVVLIADGLYNNATTVEQVEAAQARPCFGGLRAERVSDAFTYETATDQMVCGEGHRSIGKARVGQGDLYYFSMHDCAACPRRPDCLTRGEREGKAQPRRRVYLSDVRKRQVVAGETGHAWRKAHLKLRSRIEPKFAEQMVHHGLRQARYWGLAKVTGQVLLNALTVNLKRAVKLLARAAAAASPPAPVPATG
jgi:IS5 family transposase